MRAVRRELLRLALGAAALCAGATTTLAREPREDEPARAKRSPRGGRCKGDACCARFGVPRPSVGPSRSLCPRPTVSALRSPHTAGCALLLYRLVPGARREAARVMFSAPELVLAHRPEALLHHGGRQAACIGSVHAHVVTICIKSSLFACPLRARGRVVGCLAAATTHCQVCVCVCGARGNRCLHPGPQLKVSRFSRASHTSLLLPSSLASVLFLSLWPSCLPVHHSQTGRQQRLPGDAVLRAPHHRTASQNCHPMSH